MRILVVGATGVIGSEIVRALEPDHEVLRASFGKSPIRVDLERSDSIEAMYRQTGKVDAVVSAAGQAKFAPLAELRDADFALSLRNKLMGQVNLVRLGFGSVRDSGSFTLTSGVLASSPMVGSAAISLVNAAIEGFVRAAALEAPRGIRVNAVSPPWVAETLRALGMDPTGGLPAATVARAYVESVTGPRTGAVIEPKG
ncbi:MAG TPA: short chain dehydrogenase [Thermoanaerobaculia bacterium]|nr:short chain dehydrogenase [Thermoanaerobaculia bacterium]